MWTPWNLGVRAVRCEPSAAGSSQREALEAMHAQFPDEPDNGLGAKAARIFGGGDKDVRRPPPAPPLSRPRLCLMGDRLARGCLAGATRWCRWAAPRRGPSSAEASSPCAPPPPTTAPPRLPPLTPAAARYQGDKHTSQKMMRARIGAQGITVIIIAVGAVIARTEAQKRKEREILAAQQAPAPPPS